MALSPSHKFGQIIGDLLEHAMRKPIQDFVDKYPDLYLDMKGSRPTRKPKTKVSWRDANGSSHDLDLVIERSGTPTQIGRPVAFIEIAWRRYTKHSRNKAQEIQGAILPLVEKYKWNRPFIGVILGGVFTTGSLTQLKSCGFEILYYDYNSVLKAFASVGIDASFDENTPDNLMAEKVNTFLNLKNSQLLKIENHLRGSKKADINRFMNNLSKAISTSLKSISISVQHGHTWSLSSLDEAVKFIQNYQMEQSSLETIRFEITITYMNGDKIEGSFGEKEKAVTFVTEYCR